MSLKKSRKVFNFVSRKPGLQDWVRDFSAHLKSNPYKNIIIYPESFADGFAKVGQIEEGLTYRIVDYHLNTDFIFLRKPSDKFFLIIYLYKYENCEKLSVTVNEKLVVDSDEPHHETILMTNSTFSQKLLVTKNTLVKGLTIQLSEGWLREKIENTETSHYNLLQQMEVFQSMVNPKSQKLLNEIFESNRETSIPELFINTRVLRLLEDLLDNILKQGTATRALPKSARDVHNLQKVETILLENFDLEFPKIEFLSKVACMSPTKLKTVFKNAFGMGMFEYYQHNRMHKAKELLRSGVYSVTEVGNMLGYRNLSNFSTAFYKVFNRLPKDWKKIG